MLPTNCSSSILSFKRALISRAAPLPLLTYLLYTTLPFPETLNEVFSEFGEIEYCQHLTEREEPFRRRGFGFVTFSSKEAADASCEALDGLEVDGRMIKVNIAQPKTF